jgi:hypothetical protein
MITDVAAYTRDISVMEPNERVQLPPARSRRDQKELSLHCTAVPFSMILRVKSPPTRFLPWSGVFRFRECIRL